MNIKSGDHVQWTTWTGATVTKRVAYVSDERVVCVADSPYEIPMFWEATNLHTLEESMSNITVIPA